MRIVEGTILNIELNRKTHIVFVDVEEETKCGRKLNLEKTKKKDKPTRKLQIGRTKIA